jgi:WD40 repeat protein
LIGAGKPALPEIRPDGTVIDGAYLGGYHAAVSHDGHTIAIMHCNYMYYKHSDCLDPTIRLWSATNYQQLGEAFTDTGLTGAGEIPDVAVSPDSKSLAVVGCHTQDCTSGELRVWNIASHQLLGNPAVTHLALSKVTYSPDGRVLAAYGNSRAAFTASSRYGGDAIYLWDVPTGRLFVRIGSIASDSSSFVFSPNSKRLAAPYCSHFTQGACDHVQIGLWDPQDPINTRQIINDSTMQNPDRLVFNPASTILVATQGGNVALWDVATGKRIRELNVGYPSAFTPDGRMLITDTTYCTASNNCRGSAIQLRDVDTLNPVGPPLAVYTGYNVEGMQVSNNTNPLYGWSVHNGMVVSWDFSVDSWQTLACQMANRNLTHSEWKQFIGYIPYHKTCPNLPGPSDKEN